MRLSLDAASSPPVSSASSSLSVSEVEEVVEDVSSPSEVWIFVPCSYSPSSCVAVVSVEVWESLNTGTREDRRSGSL